MGRKERTLLIAIGANIVLIVLRFFLADVSGSVALKASAWHSFSDVFVSLFVLAGFIIARIVEKPHLKKISKIENIIALVVSFFIIGVGLEILREVIMKPAQDLRNIPMVILWSLLTVVICYLMSRYKLYVGQQTNSPALLADGYHSRMDVYTSVIVIAGLAGYLIGFNNLDKLVAVIMVLFIFYTGWEIFSSALKALTVLNNEVRDLKDESFTQRIVDFFEKYSKRGGLKRNVAEISIKIIRWLEKTERQIDKVVQCIKERRGLIIHLTLGALALLYLATGFYIIGPDETGIVRRFGKKTEGALSPGLYYRFPKPVEVVNKVKTSSILQAKSDSFYLLTGDENLVKINLAVHYQIVNPEDYLFKLKNSDKLLQQAANAALSQVVAERVIDEIITKSRQEIQETVQKLLQEILDKNESGVKVFGVQLLTVMPPDEALEAFRDVFSAREDKEAYINEAHSYANQIIPEARGESEKTWKSAEGYRTEKINSASGEALRFQNRLKGYSQAKEVTKTRLRLETMEKILPGAKKYIVSSKITRGSQDLWFTDDKSKTQIIK